MLVFVYGTLMKGRWNHNFLLNEKFIGQGSVLNYGLYNVSSFPGVIRKDGAKVLGELYDVSEKTLEKLDILEGEGSMYLRRAVMVETEQSQVEAYIYVWNRKVKDEDFIEFNNLPWRPNNKRGDGFNERSVSCNF